jgi:hypothetical protein
MNHVQVRAKSSQEIKIRSTKVPWYLKFYLHVTSKRDKRFSYATSTKYSKTQNYETLINQFLGSIICFSHTLGLFQDLPIACKMKMNVSQNGHASMQEYGNH